MRTAQVIVRTALVLGVLVGADREATGAGSWRQRQPAPTVQADAGLRLTVIGCIVEASDQPGTFAIRRVDKPASTAAPQVGKPITLADATVYQIDEGTSTSRVKQHVGRRVQISGTATLAKDLEGEDLEITPVPAEKTTFTAVELKAVPRLTVMSVDRRQGDCPGGPPK